ncbi:MAG: tetratricopeptide repeat protein [Hyphomicrobiales bacterium]|nr:tetratricopeptide repeat protein [Hyphomicrobiales bacterium]
MVNIQKATNSEAESPLARAERLDKLYTRLANKDISERAAQELVSVIERVWLDSGSHTVDFLMERALAATRSQNYDISIQILNRVVELAPDYAEGWNQLAVAYYLSENFDQTLPPLLRALSLDRRHFKAIEGYGVLMREMGNKRAALSAFRRVLVINPRSSSAREAEAELSREIDGQGI